MTLLILGLSHGAPGQTSRPPTHPPASEFPPVTITVVDQNGVAVPSALVTIEQQGQPTLRLVTDYAGRSTWTPRHRSPYSVLIQKGGFYQATQAEIDPQEKTLRLTLTHEEVLQQEVSVHASTPGIDPDQISDESAMNVPEIVNVPFPTNRDIRNLLPFTPSVIADSSGQVHVAGGETWMTLDTLDGFDIRNPVYGTLDLRISTDAVRSIDTETTRYPVEYGRSTGGVIAFTTGMGDNKFRYDATDFVPSFRNQNGIRFDTFEPRITFSGPIRRNRAWYFDAIDPQYQQILHPRAALQRRHESPQPRRQPAQVPGQPRRPQYAHTQPAVERLPLSL